MAAVPTNSCKAIAQSLLQTLSGGDTVDGATFSQGSAVTGCAAASNTITVVYNN